MSYDRLGALRHAQGDLAVARTAYAAALALRDRLAAADPTNTEWQRDRSFCLTKLAQLHDQLADCAAALRLTEQSLEVDERLAALDPTNVMWQADVRVSRALVARRREKKK